MGKRLYRKATLAKYKNQIARLEAIEGGYTVDDIRRVTDYQSWSEWRKQLSRYNLGIKPPIDSLEMQRQRRYEMLVAACGKNRMSLEQARQLLAVKKISEARRRLDSLAKYGYDVKAIVAYTPREEMEAAIDESDKDLDKRRQPEPLRVVGLEAKDVGGGWYQFGRDDSH